MNPQHDRAFFGTRSDPSRFAPSPTSSTALSSPVHKGFGTMPSASRGQDMVSGADKLAAAQIAMLDEDLGPGWIMRVPKPRFFAVFLLGPGTETLRQLILDHAPYLDEGSGDSLHWLTIGDPRGCGDGFLAYLKSREVPFQVLARDWEALAAARGSEQGVVAFEVANLARRFDVAPEEMPLLLLFMNGFTFAPVHVRLPKTAGSSLDTGQAVLRLLGEQLGAEVLENILRRLKTHTPKAVRGALTDHLVHLTERLDALDAGRRTAVITKELQKQTAFQLVVQGMSITAAAREAGISRQTLYKDPKTKQLLERVRASRHSGMAGVRPGEKSGGVVESGQVENAPDEAEPDA